jgi:Zn finger protein HypA/HybF involved in hydrogenase expression
MGKVITFEEIVAKSKAKHGNRYKYIRLKRDEGRSVEIVCECSQHGEFTLRAARHYTEGKGCPRCSVITSKEEFLTRAEIKHGNKYDYMNVEFNSLIDKVKIICPEHGEFIQKAGDHLLYYGCPKCGVKTRAKKKTKNTAWFIAKAKEVHGDRYDYSKTIYTTARNKVIITCKEHGDFEQKAIMHTSQKQGCPICGGMYGKTTEEFIRDAKKVHGDKYSYFKTKYIGALDKVTITCPKHGDFQQQASNHLCKSGCPSCSVTGFDISKPSILYYIEVNDNGSKYYKIGITNLTVQQRFTAVERNKIKVISTTSYMRGEDAYNEEQKLLKEYREFRYTGSAILESGNTEIFTKDVLGELHE